MFSGRTSPRALSSSPGLTFAHIAFWLALSALLFRGYAFGTGDQAEQLPPILRLLDPNYLSRDWFVNSTGGFGPRTFYSAFVALFARFLGVELAFALLHFACWIAFAIGAARLAGLLMKENGAPRARFFAGILAAWMFWAWGTRVTGANSWLSNLLTPAEVANTLGLWAIVLWLEKRRFASAIFVLIAGAIHPLIGPLGGFTLALASAWSERTTQNKSSKTSLVLWLALIAAIAIPLLAGYLGDRGGASLTPEQKKQAIYVLAFERHPWHYVPWTWGTSTWRVWALLLGLGLWARREVGAIRLLDGFALVSIAFTILGWVSIVWQPLWPLVKLQPFRMTIWLELATFFYLSIFLGRRLNSDDTAQRFSVAPWIWTSIFVLQNVGSLPRVGLCVALLLASEIVLKQSKNAFPIQLALFVPMLFLGHSGGVRLMLWLALVPLLALVGGAWALQFERGRRFIAPLSFVGVALLALVALAPIPKIKGARGKIFSGFNYSQPFKGPQAEVARWAKSNTPENALFLLPPQEGDFRLPARRAIVVNFKTFAWGDKGLLDWRERISDVTGNKPLALGNNFIEELSDKYNALTPQQITSLQQKYGFDYVVVNAQKSLNWPLVFQTKEWKVYSAPS